MSALPEALLHSGVALMSGMFVSARVCVFVCLCVGLCVFFRDSAPGKISKFVCCSRGLVNNGGVIT